MAALQAYWGLTVSVADTEGAKNIWAACAAIDPSVPTHAQSVQIQASDDNGAHPIAIGDLHVSAARCGIRLLLHDGQPEKHPVASGLPWVEMYMFSPDAGATVKLNVEIWL